MTTLIVALSKGNKGKIRKCDDRCYNAVTPPSRCCCMCNGINHGKGLVQAMENTNKKLPPQDPKDPNSITAFQLSLEPPR